MDINSGYATVVYGPTPKQETNEAQKSKQTQEGYCWHLPGGATTTSRERAEQAAAEINAIMINNDALNAL